MATTKSQKGTTPIKQTRRALRTCAICGYVKGCILVMSVFIDNTSRTCKHSTSICGQTHRRSAACTCAWYMMSGTLFDAPQPILRSDENAQNFCIIFFLWNLRLDRILIRNCSMDKAAGRVRQVEAPINIQPSFDHATVTCRSHVKLD